MPSIAEQAVDRTSPTSDLDWAKDGARKFAGANQSQQKSSFAKSITVLTLTWILSVGWLGTHLNRGWVPHDDGMLAHNAERVLNGELPHRDFDEVYTGGLTYLHATAFRMFGTNLMSLRYMLLIFAAIWIPALYFCASRFANPFAAGLVTLLSVAWSVPNYPAAMPSWYNLFFATFGAAALLRYLDSRGTRWLFVAGLCGGLSVLVKSPGIYFVAAALLFFVYLEQSQARENPSTLTISPANSLNAYRIFLTISVLALVAFLTLLIRPIATLPRLYNFVLPGLSLGLLLLSRESSVAALPSRARFLNLFQLVLPFMAGFAAPLVLFLIPYAVSHSLHSIYEGVCVIPFQRLKMAEYPPPKLSDLIAIAPLAALFAFSWYSKRRESWVVAGAILAIMIVVLIVSPKDFVVYRFVWYSVYAVTPLVIGVGALALNRNRAGWNFTGMNGQKLFLMLSTVGLCSMIMFPYSSATYFCYFAPLLALALLALTSSRSPAPRLMPALLAIFFIAFVTLLVTPGMGLDAMIWGYAPPRTPEALGMPRAGGLRVEPDQVVLYTQVLNFVQQKATNGKIYAGPDTPELYFLGGYSNPSRMVYDAFESYSGETARVLAAVDASQPDVIVINRIPTVSTPFPAELVNILNARYPQMQNFGKFQVRWRQ